MENSFSCENNERREEEKRKKEQGEERGEETGIWRPGFCAAKAAMEQPLRLCDTQGERGMGIRDSLSANDWKHTNSSHTKHQLQEERDTSPRLILPGI